MEINVGYCKYGGKTYPIIQEVAGICRRYILLSSFIELCGKNTSSRSIQRYISNNKIKLLGEKHIIDIKENSFSNNETKLKLLLEISDKKKAHIYIIDELAARFLFDKSIKRYNLSRDVLKLFDENIDIYEETDDTNRYRFINSEQFNNLMKSLKDNEFIKVVNKTLVLPQGCKEAISYRHKYIEPFKKAYKEEATEYILGILDINDNEEFLKLYFADTQVLLKESYVLSTKLYNEYKSLLTEVKKIYERHLNHIKAKYIEKESNTKIILLGLKERINTNVYSSKM